MVKKTDSKKKRKAANYDYTAGSRGAKYRDNMRELGFKLKQFFVHPDDWEDVKKILAERRDTRRKLIEAKSGDDAKNNKPDNE